MILWKLVYISAFIWFNKCVFAGNLRCTPIENEYLEGSNEYFEGSTPDYNCEFNCSENSNERNMFTSELENYYVTRDEVFSINLRGCRFHEIGTKIFKELENLKTLVISDKLQQFYIKLIRSANGLEGSSSNSHLNELEPNWLSLLDLQILDLSNRNLTSLNMLNNLGIGTFANVTLSLKRNNISNIELGTFSHQRELVSLDLSENNLTHLNEHVFDELIYLKHLNLSHNPIGNLEIGTFAYLTQLETLLLKSTNISNIELGTFSHQHKLISLDLSENNLKKLDFELFLPILHDLQSLYLNQNQLTDFHGFRNSIFPHLTLLDIKNNQFNCSYLRSFIANIDWSKLHMPVDPQLTKVHETNIRGVNCKNSNSSESTRTNKYPEDEMIVGNNNGVASTQYVHQLNTMIEITSKSLQQLHTDNNFMKFLLVSVCICLIALIILTAFLNRHQFSIFVNPQNGNDRRNKFSDPTVEYRNDELPLN